METLERPSQEEAEEIDINEVAARAAGELIRIIESQEGESTKNIRTVRDWLESEADKSDESFGQVVHALQDAHIILPDQKKVNLDEEIKNVINLLGEFTKDPRYSHDFYNRNPNVTHHLLTFLEELSGKKEE